MRAYRMTLNRELERFNKLDSSNLDIILNYISCHHYEYMALVYDGYNNKEINNQIAIMMMYSSSKESTIESLVIFAESDDDSTEDGNIIDILYRDEKGMWCWTEDKYKYSHLSEIESAKAIERAFYKWFDEMDEEDEPSITYKLGDTEMTTYICPETWEIFENAIKDTVDFIKDEYEMETVRYESHYSADGDITYVHKEIYIGTELKSSEVIGFYYGKPDIELTKIYMNRIKAEF